jgi:hypothetical protein
MAKYFPNAGPFLGRNHWRGPVDWTGPLPFGYGVFANASERIFVDPVTPRIVGPFAGGTPAIAKLPDGRRYIQLETARTNIQGWNREYDNIAWTKQSCTVDADATNDPLGNLTADKIEETIADDYHRVYEAATIVTGNYYSLSAYMKQDERDEGDLQISGGRFVLSPYGIFDLDTGTVLVENACVAGILGAQNDWWRGAVTALSDDNGANSQYLSVANGGVRSYPGTAGYGAFGWNVQMEIGRYPLSPIHTPTGASVTRAKDQFYFPAVNVPDAILSGKWALKWIPSYSSSEDTNNHFLAFDANNRIYFTSNKVTVTTGGVTRVQSNALTFPRYAELTVVFDSVAGTITVTGATAGDGTVVGAAWTFPRANMRYGMYFTDTFQINGLLSEPYRQ